MNVAHITLAEMLAHEDLVIRRNAFSILKQLHKKRDREIKSMLSPRTSQT